MAKISYEDKGNKSTVELCGTSHDIFIGICRLIVNVKPKMTIKDGKSFEELLLEGIKTAEKEKKFADLLEKADIAELLKELLDD